jgi:hypothetical protein
MLPSADSGRLQYLAVAWSPGMAEKVPGMEVEAGC